MFEDYTKEELIFLAENVTAYLISLWSEYLSEEDVNKELKRMGIKEVE